ncbi:ankyrin-1-like isoform X1 [Uranotaenia lowii]|uniref:ankyrin-1-like isoform X1 n=2 Tax=Uranotaenia lowii TaxID=190385 RepID=UPI002478A59D|nr:ankyrin-1-like isoform X1 [Uranotaenia lowii]
MNGRGRIIAMPAECAANPLQRALADAIIRMVPNDELRILLACGAKVNEQVTQGLRPLHYAVWQNNEAAVNLLLVRNAEIDAIDEVGYSALHLAAEHGYYDLAKTLLDSGCKVDYREPSDDPYPRTTLCDEPLRLALRNKHYEVARLLLSRGADPNKRYFFGSEINLANDIESLELLLAYGANTEARDRSGITPLMRAVRTNGSIDSVLLLLQYGANVNAMTDARNDYRTVLHYAVLSGNASLVNMLIKQGARVDIPAPLPEPDSPSPLDLAVLRGDPVLVRILLENGANVNRSNPIIGSPLHVACADNIPNRVEIMKMLFSYGADPNMRVIGDVATNAILRPPLAELVASNLDVTPAELRILMRYGARVILKTQFRDPDGLLNFVSNMDPKSDSFRILLEAAEEFDPCMIRRNALLKPEQRKLLLQRATSPMTLKSRLRAHFRRIFGRNLPVFVPSLFIPQELKSYLLYEHSF